MTSHELARELLDLPDLPIVGHGWSYEGEDTVLEVTPQLVKAEDGRFAPDEVKGRDYISILQ